MTVSVFAIGAGRAMAVAASSAELALLFVFDVFVLLARAGGTMPVRAGVAVATFTHKNSPSFENVP